MPYGTIRKTIILGGIEVKYNKKAGISVPAFSLSINLKVYSFVGYAAFSVFPLTCAAEKHLVSEKPQNIAVFQGHWGGIGGDRAQSENL